MTARPLAGAGIALLGLLLTAAAGCSSPPVVERDVLLVGPDQYEQAFDAVVEASRREGMPAALRDRRAGLILTDYRIAASLLEPWDTNGEPFGQTFENTIAEQRRRARIEFVRAGRSPRFDQQSDPEAALAGLTPPEDDLTTMGVDVEMHVRVFLERAYEPGQRRSTWTRQRPSRTEIVVPGDPEQVLPAKFWTPVSRDRAAEERLIEAVETALTEPPPADQQQAASSETQPIG